MGVHRPSAKQMRRFVTARGAIHRQHMAEDGRVGDVPLRRILPLGKFGLDPARMLSFLKATKFVKDLRDSNEAAVAFVEAFWPGRKQEFLEYLSSHARRPWLSGVRDSTLLPCSWSVGNGPLGDGLRGMAESFT